MKKGDRVKTNAKFSKIFEGGATWSGRLVSSIELEKQVVWRVRVDGMPKLQRVAEKFLIKEKA